MTDKTDKEIGEFSLSDDDIASGNRFIKALHDYKIPYCPSDLIHAVAANGKGNSVNPHVLIEVITLHVMAVYTELEVYEADEKGKECPKN